MIVALHIFIWTMLIGLYSFIFKAYHPSIEISVISTSLLMFGSAIAVYTNLLLKAQRFNNQLTMAKYVLLLVFVVLISTVIVVFSIQLVYDKLVGPNPLRFGLSTNLVLDFIWIVFHLLFLSGVFSLLKFSQKLVEKRNG